MQILINADEVYKTLESYEIKETLGKPLTDWEYGYNCGIERAKSEIECAPTVDAEPVRPAYWIKKMTVKLCVGFDVYEPHWYCSCCKEKYEPSFAQICKYCYVCGSKMNGKSPEEYELAKKRTDT